MRTIQSYSIHTDYSDFLKAESASTGTPQSHIIEEALYHAHPDIDTPPGAKEKNGRKPKGWKPEGG